MGDLALGLSSPPELRARIEAEREGYPHLIYRDAEGGQVIHRLNPTNGLVTIGRSASADICLPWAADMSRVHAELEDVSGAWMICDDGLSRNGTAVNGDRVVGRRRLQHGDVVSMGATMMVFMDPGDAGGSQTRSSLQSFQPPKVSESQRRVLAALCRPLPGIRAVLAAGDESADRRGALPERRHRQEAPARALQ
jgi:predicted component of type VI protein secretion system